MFAFSKFEALWRKMLSYKDVERDFNCLCKAFSPSPKCGLALGGHFVSGLMHGFSGCHFDYISESVAAAASRAAGLMKAHLLK